MLVVTMASVLGLLAIGVGRMLTTPKAAETVRVVAAAKDIPAGCKLSFANLHYVEMPKQYFKEGMLQGYENVVGKYTRTFVSAREPFAINALMSGNGGLTGDLPKGSRAITLKFTDETSVDSQVRSGDRVDVVATSTYQSKKYTKTIAQNLLVVLSTPKEALLSETGHSQDGNKVTLAVSPTDAELLSEAVENSKLRLTLRSFGDLSKAILQGSDERDLLPHEALRQEPPKAIVEGQSPVAAMPPLPPPPLSAADSVFAALPEAAVAPVKWVVEMFSGSRRENHEIEMR